MRLLAGVLASAPFSAELTGDESLSTRPMERVAEPLRRMGASVETLEGHAPVTITGGSLRGIAFEPGVPSAQVKSAVLLAGLDADDETEVRERVATRDHTERALRSLGVPVTIEDRHIRITRASIEGFAGTVPGDPSSAAFLVGAAALTGSELTIEEVGLNPSRLHYLAVMQRMGVPVSTSIDHEEVGEPVGTIQVGRCDGLRPVRVEPEELPLIVDEVPILAALAAFAPGDSWFLEAAELRVKESDRLKAVADGIRALGGTAADEGVDLVLAGGGLAGGRVSVGGDHRMAMAFAVAALAADGPSRIDGVDAAEVSFPGFVDTLRAIGVELEVT